MKLIIMNEGIDYTIKSKNDAVDCILEEYNKFELCIGELLESLELQGFSIQDVVDIYARVINIIDGDKVYVKSEGECRPR